jgi:hypothetical protein
MKLTKTKECIMQSTTENKFNFSEATNITLKNDHILIFLKDGTVIRKHVNFFKHVMGIKFTPISKKAAS